jgi:hypothetical protein
MSGGDKVVVPAVLEIQAHMPAIFRQLIEAFDPLTMVREQLSNIMAKEVGAKNISVTHYYDRSIERPT